MSKQAELNEMRTVVFDSLYANKTYFESHKRKIQQFSYLLLWRPVELMLDYMCYKNSVCSPELFWHDRNSMSVDEKYQCLFANCQDRGLCDGVNYLRDLRNAILHGYRPRLGFQPKPVFATYDMYSGSVVKTKTLGFFNESLAC